MAQVNSRSCRQKVIMTKTVLISEVGPRDGLQNCKAVMPTAIKKRWIKALYQAGVQEIEVGSFVPPKLFPQLADTAEITAYARTLLGLDVAALTPNLRGAKDAVMAGATKITLPLSVSETHSLKNLRKTHDQVIDQVTAISEFLGTLPKKQRPHFEGSLSTAFGCSLEGHIPEAQILSLAERLVEAGVDEVGISDTTGYATPKTIKSLIRALRGAVGDKMVQGVHLHNTQGLGIANAYAALEEGISTFDASQGGLGGCPASPGASGNIVTEDLVYMFEAMGVATGIDMEKLMACREILREGLPGEPIYGFTPDAGLPKIFQT